MDSNEVRLHYFRSHSDGLQREVESLKFHLEDERQRLRVIKRRMHEEVKEARDEEKAKADAEKRELKRK